MGRSKNLNKLFDYCLLGFQFTPTAKTSNVISNHVIASPDDWYKKKFNPFRKEFKQFYVSKQKFRCAVCRFKIQADGHYEDIDHVIAKSKRKAWSFVNANLICTCTPCNRLKNADNTLNSKFSRVRKFPDNNDAFLVFNPHYEKWSDHFLIEDGIFLTAKQGSKGLATIQVYHLYRYQVCVNLSNEQDQPNYKNDAKKVLKKLYRVAPHSDEEKELTIAKKRFEKYV